MQIHSGYGILAHAAYSLSPSSLAEDRPVEKGKLRTRDRNRCLLEETVLAAIDRRALLGVVLATAALAAVPSQAIGGEENDTPPPPSTLSISATPNPLPEGGTTTISGKLESYLTILAVIELQANEAPYTGGFQPVATTMTDAPGRYSFSGIRPRVGTRYRARSVFPITSSGELLVRFARRISLRLSDRTPRAGRRIRFSGTVTPAAAGATVYIQRRTRRNRFRTVARARLRASTPGVSTYSRLLRIRRSAVYRARVSADRDHAPGTSARRRARVH